MTPLAWPPENRKPRVSGADAEATWRSGSMGSGNNQKSYVVKLFVCLLKVKNGVPPMLLGGKTASPESHLAIDQATRLKQ
jgi:hypothetical protein